MHYGNFFECTCWAVDVIHPTSHTYAKMALHLLEAIAPQDTPRPSGSAQAGGGRGGGGDEKLRTPWGASKELGGAKEGPATAGSALLPRF
jgi:hypothetical protein